MQKMKFSLILLIISVFAISQTAHARFIIKFLGLNCRGDGLKCIYIGLDDNLGNAAASQSSGNYLGACVMKGSTLTSTFSKKIFSNEDLQVAQTLGFVNQSDCVLDAEVCKEMGIGPNSYIAKGTYTATTNGDLISFDFPVTKAATITYTPPKNDWPQRKAILTEKDLLNGLTFRWSPLCCIIRNPPDYRVNVWQVGAGKDAAQVMQTQKPVISELVKAQTQFTVRKGWDGKGNYVWRVEAIDSQGKVLAVSEATDFKIESLSASSAGSKELPKEIKN